MFWAHFQSNQLVLNSEDTGAPNNAGPDTFQQTTVLLLPSLHAVPDLVRNSKRVRAYYDENQISNFKHCFKQSKMTNTVSHVHALHVAKPRRCTKRKATSALPRAPKTKATSDYGWRGESELPRVLASLPPSLKNRFTSQSIGRPPEQ